MNSINEFKELYLKTNKHSNYQILASSFDNYADLKSLPVKSRFERERLDFILDTINIKGKTILDIGANTGYFSFELIKNGASNLVCYEGNLDHANILKLGSEILHLETKIKVYSQYFSFDEYTKQAKYDIALLLNVLHHFGDDYGASEHSITQVKESIIKQLNSVSQIAKALIFQLGFNWKGNPKLGLFQNGTKKEMIDFISSGVKNHWDISRIGIARKVCNDVSYEDLNDLNIIRNDSLGEFLNRPIFILKSL